MLEMRSNCEACQRSLRMDGLDGMICSYECTFCTECAHGVLGMSCPNCGGELVRRPRRVVTEVCRLNQDPMLDDERDPSDDGT